LIHDGKNLLYRLCAEESDTRLLEVEEAFEDG
jgi:hypothetical protein